MAYDLIRGDLLNCLLVINTSPYVAGAEVIFTFETVRSIIFSILDVD